MSNHERRSIPKEIEGRIMIRCRRRCCLCAFWADILDQKDGQIAHIDRDRSNGAEDNLAYLCQEHHDQYDAVHPQTRRITPAELRHARDALYQRMATGASVEISVEVKLNSDFDKFTPKDQAGFLSLVQEVLHKGGRVKVIQKCPGCVSLTLGLDAQETQLFFRAVEAGAFARYALIDARIVDIQERPRPVEFWVTYLRGLSAYVVPEQLALDTIANPHTEQHLFAGRSVSREASRCSIHIGRRGTGAESHTVFVLSSFLDHHPVIGFAASLYNADVEHSPDGEPLAVLRAFLARYGVDETYTGLGTKRLFLAVPLTLPPFVRSGPVAIGYLHALRRPSGNELAGDTEFLNLHFYEPEANRVFIELAFGFSRRRYALDLRRHGVDLPPDLQ